MLEDLKAAAKLYYYILFLSIVGMCAFKCGVNYGRAEYHEDLIRELEIKNGAPVLLYHPNIK